MPQGLQCWDANGNQIIDATDSFTRILGYVVTGSSGSGTIIDENFTKATPWFVTFVTRKTVDPQGFSVAISGNTLTWWFDHNNSWQYPHRIIYGVY